MVNVFSFHISWNPFISGDSIKEMASGFGVIFVCFGYGLWFLFGFVYMCFFFLTCSYGSVLIVVEF